MIEKFKNEKKILVFSVIDVLVLSFGHALNIGGIILFGLVGFAAIVLLSPKQNFLSIMLFYLPWSPVMKLSYGSFTLYTIIVPIFFLSLLILKKDHKEKKIFILDNLLITCIFIIFTITVKLFSGNSFSMSYLIFIMMLVFIPIYLNLYKRKISFEWCIIFFSTGIISAGLSSKVLMNYSHMKQFIDVYELESVGLTRLSGFYGDANFYSAHILVAISGLLIIALNKNVKNTVLLIATAVVLIYFGLLSVSKMFLLDLLAILGIWIIAVISLRGKVGTKISTFVCVVVVVVFILLSGIFEDEINMYMIRFGMVDSTSSFTTGRSDLFSMYISFLGGNVTALLFGQGYTNMFEGNTFAGSHNSILQAIFQFGCVGIIFLILWITQLSRIAGKVKKTSFSASNIYLILAFSVACFAPWFALDILFFDEFFYITILFFVGKRYVMQK